MAAEQTAHVADLREAATFLDMLHLGGRFTFQTFDDSEAKRKGLAEIRHGTLQQQAAWLSRMNAAGAGVFVAVNETDGKGRTHKHVQRVRALFVDLDGAPIEPVREGPLPPQIIVESSRGRWHAYWLVSGCELADFRPLQRGLAARFGGDKACVDLPRVMRLPGFWHQKKGAPCMTRIVEIAERPAYPLQDVLAAFGWSRPADAEPVPPAPAAASAAVPPLSDTTADVSEDVRDALRCLPSDGYEEWIRIGMCLAELGDAGLPLWLEWSSKSAKYDAPDAMRRWPGFRPDKAGYRGVFAAAKLHGWDPRQAPSVKRKREARRHLRSVERPLVPPPEDPGPPDADSRPGHSVAGPAIDLSPAALLARYESIYGTQLVWDTVLSISMPFAAFATAVGKDAAKGWRDAGPRKRLQPEAGGKGGGRRGGGKKRAGDGDYSGPTKVDWMLPRYVLIYGDEAVFDREQRREITLGALRAFCGLKAVRDWGDHPRREVVNEELVVFDPRRPPTDGSVCNLWAGWPIEAAMGSEEDQQAVRRWLRVLHYACGESDAVMDWLLKWIAYPLRHPGAKMRTSVIMHGPEGSGKNTVWDAIRRIYGRYGIQIGQTQLEQQWCDWISAKLFIVGNEVLHRQEQVHQKGRLKSLITEQTIRVERKFMNGRTEGNFANLVFLSNELIPLNIDPGDRRFLVVWTPPAHPDGYAFYRGLGEDAMPDSTVQALYHYLLQVELDDFGPHTKPPMTEAKRDLIEASMESHQRFVRDWLAGVLPIAPRPCMTRQLYHAYLFWCREYGERFPKPENKFAARAKKEMTSAIKRYATGIGGAVKQATFYLPAGSGPPPGESDVAWLGRQTEDFGAELRQWRDDQ